MYFALEFIPLQFLTGVNIDLFVYVVHVMTKVLSFLVIFSCSLVIVNVIWHIMWQFER